jgi:EpsD family peptidyl-prolyl cis-trans isomerase
MALRPLLSAALAAALLAGCERAALPGASAEVVVATVNGVEIAVREAQSRPVLDRIIERELLVQKALEAGLDRDPAVARAIDNARRQVLAQAYLERSARAAGGAYDEIRGFYADNPVLFAQRRIYRVRELAVSAPPEMLEALRAEAARAADLEEVAASLRRRGVPFDAFTSSQPAEQVPLARLPRLAAMQKGEIAVFAGPAGLAVVQLVQAEEAPLSERQAAPAIGQFLRARSRMELAAAQVRLLRQAAQIEYMGIEAK